MKRDSQARTAAFILAVFFAGAAHGQCSRDHVLTVTGAGHVAARPDVAILTVAIHSSAPLAADAVAANAKKAADVQSALTALGFSSGDVRITPVTILKAGTPYYGPNQAEVITGIEAQQYVYVFFKGDQLKDQKAFADRVAAVVDALGKINALPANNRYAPQQGASFLIYAIENPAEYERQAQQKAIDEARSDAQAIAAKMGIQITGVCSASTNRGGAYGGGIAGGVADNFAALSQQVQDPLAELPYRFYSAHPEQVIIQESATITYSFK